MINDLKKSGKRKISLHNGGFYIKSPKWINDKKNTINPKNNQDDMCFKYMATVALNLENIGKHLETIIRIRPFMYQYSWKETDFSTKSKDWKKFEIDNKIIAINVLFSKENREEIKQA